MNKQKRHKIIKEAVATALMLIAWPIGIISFISSIRVD